MIVNAIKTKVMVFGEVVEMNVFFNNVKIDQVMNYKYTGNMIKTIYDVRGDIFRDNYDYFFYVIKPGTQLLDYTEK